MGNAIYKKSLVTSDDGDGVMVFDGQNYFDFNISPDEQYIYYTEPALGSHLMKKDLTISSSILDTTQLISNYVSSWSLSKDGSKVFYSDGMFIFSNDTNQPDYSIPLTS